MGNKKITTKLSRLKSVSSTDDYYLEAATGAILKNFVIFTGNTCAGVQQLFVFGCLFTVIKKNWSFGKENVHWN